MRCGIVISDKTEEKGPEWRTFVTSMVGREGDYGNRTGMPFSLARSDMGLSTIMGRTNKDGRGNKINSSMLSRLRRWDYRIQLYDSTDKSLTQAFTMTHGILITPIKSCLSYSIKKFRNTLTKFRFYLSI